ncbi:MAG: GNAT family N-acetyltransferase [Gemmataceae bacterium]|nr:GNAT family N-acetyltransferase [Gemmataceae bacterium]
MMPPDWRPLTLSTDRLVLRPFAEADAPALFPLAANPAVTRFTLWEHHKTLDDTLVFVRDYAQSRYMEGTPEPYAITFRDDPKGEPVGAVGCFWASRPNGGMELGYWLAEPYWGRGLVVEACRAVVSEAFAACHPQRVQARVIAGNDPSRRVLDKLGFRHEGTLRSSLFRRGRYEDVLMYSVLRGEWPV